MIGNSFNRRKPDGLERILPAFQWQAASGTGRLALLAKPGSYESRFQRSGGFYGHGPRAALVPRLPRAAMNDAVDVADDLGRCHGVL